MLSRVPVYICSKRGSDSMETFEVTSRGNGGAVAGRRREEGGGLERGNGRAVCVDFNPDPKDPEPGRGRNVPRNVLRRDPFYPVVYTCDPTVSLIGDRAIGREGGLPFYRAVFGNYRGGYFFQPLHPTILSR